MRIQSIICIGDCNGSDYHGGRKFVDITFIAIFTGSCRSVRIGSEEKDDSGLYYK